MGQIQTAPGGGGGGGGFSGAQISLAAARNAVNESGTLSYDTEDFDIGGWADIVADNTIFTVPADITHVRAGGQVDFTHSVAGTTLFVMQLNGATVGVTGRMTLEFNHDNGVNRTRVGYASGFISVVQGDTLRIITIGPDPTVDFQADGHNYFWVEGFNFA